MDGADFRNAVVKSNFAQASLVNARFDGADLSPGKKNQRAMVKRGFEGANLEGASFKNANMVEVDLEFALLRNADLSGAILAGADLAGATLAGADVAGADLNGANVESAKLAGIRNLSAAKSFDTVRNFDKAFKD
jgi:uncharacterized protein YjbI with pentapeptide repeats